MTPTPDDTTDELHDDYNTPYTVADLVRFIEEREVLTHRDGKYEIQTHRDIRKPPERLSGRRPLYVEDVRRDTSENGIPYAEVDYADKPFDDDAQDWCTMRFIERASVPDEMLNAAEARLGGNK